MKTIIVAGLFALTASLFFGCNNVDNAVDCNGICDRYQTCFDADYDTGACFDKCRDNADADADYSAKADACAACIDDESCAASTFKCAADCAGIVP